MTTKFMQVEEALRKITIAKLDKMRRDVLSENTFKEEILEPTELLKEMRTSEGRKAVKIVEKNEDFYCLLSVEIRVNGIEVKYLNSIDYCVEQTVTWEELE